MAQERRCLKQRARNLISRPYGWAVIGAMVAISLIPRRME